MIDFSILYIEDDEEVLENVSFLLYQHVSKVYTAKDGESALEIYFKHKPNIIISDINIPKIDGLSVATKIREDNKEIPIIMMTAYKDSDKLLKAIDIDVSSYITKPFTITTLKEAIDKAIEKIHLQERAIKDSLTSLYNRSVFDKMVQNSIDTAKRYDTYITYMMIDIDHFKEYNDTYGHPQGDEALRKVAASLKTHTKRLDDHAFRIGGEEFSLILLGLDEEKSIKFANKIREDIVSLEIEHKNNSAHKFLSISMGIYIAKGDKILDKKDIYISSDSALYSSKSNGRNMITIAKQEQNNDTK